jgi:hypothetical protein
MGVSISWLAVSDMEPEAIHKQLGLLSSREFDGDVKYPFAGRVLPSGWYLVVANRCDSPMVRDEMLSSLSMSARVVAASIEEHVMYCFSTCWLNGRQEWRVQHEAEKGATHLQVSGSPPAELETLHQGALARQICHDESVGVDYVFDVPLELARHLVGFRHDESAPGPELEFFEILKVDERVETPLKRARWTFW